MVVTTSLMVSSFADIWEKTNILWVTAKQISLEINIDNTKCMRKNVTIYSLASVDIQEVEEVDKFIYLRRKVTTDGDCKKEVSMRITKANQLLPCYTDQSALPTQNL